MKSSHLLAILFAALFLGAAMGCGKAEEVEPPSEGKVTATDPSKAAPAKEGDKFNRYHSPN